MGIATTELSPIEQTAFLTEYARALDSQWPRPILGDVLAHEVVGKVDYDFAGLGVQTSVVCQTALRAKMLDDRVRAFISEHPDAVVVDLGAGLDSGYHRVGPPPTVHWYSVDLAGITALRDEVLPAAPQSHSVPVSLTDEQWPDAIPADRPTMLVADGLFAFLTEAADHRDLPKHHRPLRLRRARIQRLRQDRLGQPPRDQALSAEDVQRRRQPVRLSGVQGRPSPRDLESAHAAGRGGQPGRCTGGRPLSWLDPGGDQTDAAGAMRDAAKRESCATRFSPSSRARAALSDHPSAPTTA